MNGDVLGAIFDPSSPFFFVPGFFMQVLKWMFLIGFTVYFLFALVVVRQIALMTRTIKTGFELPLHIIGFLHLFLVVFVWLFAYILL